VSEEYLDQEWANTSAMLKDPDWVPESDFIYLKGVGGTPAKRLISDQTFFEVDNGEILEGNFSRQLRLAESTALLKRAFAFLYLMRFRSLMIALYENNSFCFWSLTCWSSEFHHGTLAV